ncbi:hypothetical protein E2I00_003218 [Balaenoptera physalus]|uniref:Ribonuclease A-domain domain-containing protein n=1 Tax=Balaenoptera physalus TaxID=9770 RepID=A0A643C5H2_BALPH|nr:hypothetical protein E2I00_003218 [Balaenoptera physalus]
MKKKCEKKGVEKEREKREERKQSSSLQSCHNGAHDVSVTDCFAKAGSRPPHCHCCKKDSTRPIRVGCEEGGPVHLDG